MQYQVYDNEIFYFEHIISEPYKLIDFIEETENQPNLHSLIPKWIPWGASNMPDHIYGYQKRIDVNKIDSLSGFDYQRAKYIINTIYASMRQCAENVRKAKGIEEEVILQDQFGINKYNQGSLMGPHADQYDGNMTLKYSLVTYLNDDYEGGEIEFPNQNVKIKPSAGSIIIFPSAVPYLHQSNEIIKGQKYMCPGFWLHNNV